MYFRSIVKFNQPKMLTLVAWEYGMCNYSFHAGPLRCCSTSITRIKKSAYPRIYKVRLVQPDGSMFTIRYHEPHDYIRLPIDTNTLTEDEKRERLNRLKPVKEIKVHEFDEEETEITQRSWKDFVSSR